MLTADLVSVRRKQGKLTVDTLPQAVRLKLLEVAEHLINICRSCVGQSRAALQESWDSATAMKQPAKAIKGLRKLLLDRCDFEEVSEVDPAAVRKTLFRCAAEYRSTRNDDQPFVSAEVLQIAAEELGIPADAIRSSLYSDLRENHQLLRFSGCSNEQLVEQFERAQRQAVLLRAVSVVVTLRAASPIQYRRFFQKLKFRRLLFRITTVPNGYQITLDGPFSMFQGGTKYGLQLALMLPHIEEFADWQLEADVAWGKQKQRYAFSLSSATEAPPTPETQTAPPRIHEDVLRLYQKLQSNEAFPWTVTMSETILELPGVGLCIPDLSFCHKESGQTAYLEVLGFWSRDAVWKRVDLVQAGLAEHVIFAASSRLRVSEAVLEDTATSQLYVYKGVLSDKEILRRLAMYVQQT